MNAAGATAERIYETLKAHVLRGAFRPGAKLDPAMLAEQLNSSVTPVRASLNMLVGEGLVETETGEGFHVPLLDEPALKDRYAWNAEILGMVLRKVGDRVPTAPAFMDAASPAARAAGLFLEIARCSPNQEHARAISLMNDRLHAVRVAEAAVLADVDAELDGIADAVEQMETRLLRSLVSRYHRRRASSAATILRKLYRMDEHPAE